MARSRPATPRAAALAVALTTLALVAGCGDDDDGGVALVPADEAEGGDPAAGGEAGAPADPAGDVDVCSLLTVAEIEEVVGNTVADGEAQFTNCSWIGPELEDVNVTVGVNDIIEGAITCETMRDQSPEAETVTGLGEDAWFEARGAGNFSNSDLWACTADAIVYLGLVGDRDPQFLRDASGTLMGLVLDRL